MSNKYITLTKNGAIISEGKPIAANHINHHGNGGIAQGKNASIDPTAANAVAIGKYAHATQPGQYVFAPSAFNYNDPNASGIIKEKGSIQAITYILQGEFDTQHDWRFLENAADNFNKPIKGIKLSEGEALNFRAQIIARHAGGTAIATFNIEGMAHRENGKNGGQTTKQPQTLHSTYDETQTLKAAIMTTYDNGLLQLRVKAAPEDTLKGKIRWAARIDAIAIRD